MKKSREDQTISMREKSGLW